MSFANVLLAAGIFAEALFLGILVWRRVYKSLPIFFSYIVWCLAEDSAWPLMSAFLINQSLAIWVFTSFIDSAFQYVVLIELAWSSLRPIRGSLPRGFLHGLSILIATSALLVWYLCDLMDQSRFNAELLLALHVQKSFAVLRVVFFMVLAGCRQHLSIGWRDRELQIAAGMGLYSLVSLAGTLVHSYQVYGLQYYYVDVLVSCGYLASLVYWVAGFAQKEAGRR